ncbi:Undecaprenyl-phosphate mannosyltransferase [Grimontia celer]|uniref:Undecaprenyl-phosphate mannosyltransferase n=1 Tax=Grimontia celer TaxID=1796497 RepID=A0A128F062_9GAMM|nr:glycosyltransferase family 2 protein [Grimontia celer]CZF79800.1 Undecaprenyl-phosphate mannosyltransferase [Grimontia celer]
MILIPAYEPNESLISLLEGITGEFSSSSIPMVIVNDGSEKEVSLKTFNTIRERFPNIVILTHESNMGKGAAIKTGIRFALESHYEFVITVDADGQHEAHDVKRLYQYSKYHCQKLIIGTRRFSGDIPLRSKFGNLLTRTLFNFIHSTNIEDTQSGLRYIPHSCFSMILEIKANRYELEQEVLNVCARKKIIAPPLYIDTIYEEGNPSSHFNKIRDSFLIYFVLFRAVLSGVLIAILDVIVFAIIFSQTKDADISVYLTRFLMTLLYYILLRSFVFNYKGRQFSAFIKLVTLIILNSLIVAYVLERMEPHSESTNLVYISVNILLFIINFLVQKAFIFKEKNNERNRLG